MLTIVLSTAGIIAPVGLKTVLTGAGYSHDMIPFVGPGTALGEGIMLSLCAVVIIPLILFAARHCVMLLPWSHASWDAVDWS